MSDFSSNLVMKQQVRFQLWVGERMIAWWPKIQEALAKKAFAAEKKANPSADVRITTIAFTPNQGSA